jgi:hypothetical protein
MAKTKRDPETIAGAIAGLRDILGDDPKRAPALHTLTTFGRGETDHVRVFVVGKRYGGDPARLLELTWHLACVLEKPNVPHKGVPYGGGQLNKGLEAADDLWRAAYGQGVPQLTHWWEI